MVFHFLQVLDSDLLIHNRYPTIEPAENKKELEQMEGRFKNLA